MEEEDEDAFAEEEEAISNHVDFKEPQSSEPITFRQNMNVESEPDLDRPTAQQNGQAHFRDSPFETRSKPQANKESPVSESRTLIPEVHNVIPVDGISISAGTTQENVPPAESTYPLHAPAEVTVPLTGDAPQRQEPDVKSTGEPRSPPEEPNISRDAGPTRDGKKTPTTPAQEIRFNIPFSGVDKPYVILDTQERSPEAVYEQDFDAAAKTPRDLQHGERSYVYVI